MILKPGQTIALTLRGEVVEIVEKDGRRLARVAMRPYHFLDVPVGERGEEPHLGDTLRFDARLTIEAIHPDLAVDGEDPGTGR